MKKPVFYLQYLTRTAYRTATAMKGRLQRLHTHHQDCHQECDITDISDHAVHVAKSIRGTKRKPAIMIHGVTQRSGTTYLGELLRLHPDLHAYPNDIREIPFLRFTDDVLAFQQHFFGAYPYNVDKMGRDDFLPIFGASFLSYLHAFVPEEKRMLLKVPHAQYVNYFFSVFPDEQLLLLMRDGRDVVHSTIRTWPDRRFSDVCSLWNDSAKLFLKVQQHYAQQSQRLWLVKYEDVVRDPVTFVKEACVHFQLDGQTYPFERVETIAVHGSSELKVQGNVTWEPLKKPENFQPVGRWQRWTTREKHLFKEIAGETLCELGYCDNVNW